VLYSYGALRASSSYHSIQSTALLNSRSVISRLLPGFKLAATRLSLIFSNRAQCSHVVLKTCNWFMSGTKSGEGGVALPGWEWWRHGQEQSLPLQSDPEIADIFLYHERARCLPATRGDGRVLKPPGTRLIEC